VSYPNPGPNNGYGYGNGYGGQYPPGQQPQPSYYPPQPPPQPQYYPPQQQYSPQPPQYQQQQYPPQPPVQQAAPLCNQHPMCRTLSSVPLQVLRPHFMPAVVAPSPELGADPVSKALSDDLMLVLSIRGGPHGLGGDSDGYIVAQHLASAWPIAVDELWKQAFINQRGLELKVFPVAAMNAPPAIHAVACNDWLVGAQAFRLEEVLRQALPHGALVTVSSSKSMFVWPIASRRELQNMAYFLDTARELGQAMGPRLSSRCFWLYQGTLHDLNVRDVSGGDAKISLSAGMRDVFLSLPEA